MKKKTNRFDRRDAQELSDAELDRAVGGTGLQEASVMTAAIAAPSGQPPLVQVAAETDDMMKLQMTMQRENTMFSTISNVLKTRHDTEKNSIGNVR